MAVTKVPGNSALKLVLHVGDSTAGSPILRNKSLTNLKAAAANQDVFDVATSLGNLQDYQLNGIIRVDNASIIQV
ncbi:MAG: DUF1659 domain-containing protein [Desulfotomaculaceae bacterium]|nr:DUF1659 domain-containing protein [Desulfotomaculaceae bacterium]